MSIRIEGALEERQCGGEGCATCPFRATRGYTTACAIAAGMQWPQMKALLSHLFDEEKERIDDGNRLRLDVVEKLAEELHAVHAALGSDVLLDGTVDPEAVEGLELVLTPCEGGYSADNALARVEEFWRFLDRAVELKRGVVLCA